MDNQKKYTDDSNAPVEVKQLKKRLNEYRDANTKLYKDIDDLENDIRGKDEFAEKMVKARNDCQKEIRFLKKKNTELMQENDDIVKNAQQLEINMNLELNRVKIELKNAVGKINLID